MRSAKDANYSNDLELESLQLVKLLGMEDSFNRKVNQSLLKHGLLALHNRKLTFSTWLVPGKTLATPP